MPLPALLVPILLGGVSAVAAAVGIKKGVDAKKNFDEAKKTNQRANDVVDYAKRNMSSAQNRCKSSIENLGKRKIEVLDQTVKRFVMCYDRIKHIEVEESVGLQELNKFRLDKCAFQDLKKISFEATQIVGALAGGGASGALMALGAYSAVGTFGAVTATTGITIGGLSGVAATNATLAWLGGGALAAGGWGMAGGMAVLGGLVAGPALAVLGFVVGAKAEAEKDKAYSNLAEARSFSSQVSVAVKMCDAIKERSEMFCTKLNLFENKLKPLVVQMESIIKEKGEDYRCYSASQQDTIIKSRCIAGIVKAILDTPILTKDGKLTNESSQLLTEISNVKI